MSSFTQPLTITKIGKRLWKIHTPFKYHVGYKDSLEIIFIPKDFETDLASIPKAFWFIVGHPLEEYAQAAAVHDILYRYCGKHKDRVYTRKESDVIFLEAMEAKHVSWWKRNIMYRAVRMCGFIPWNKRLKALKK